MKHVAAMSDPIAARHRSLSRAYPHFQEISVQLRFIALPFLLICSLFASALASAQDDTTLVKSETLLPGSTRAWVSVPDIKVLRAHIDSSQFGQLIKEPSLKPFIENAQSQMGKWLKERNVNFDVRMDQFEKIDAGEICIAGILPDNVRDDAIAGSHGIVLLANISKDREGAVALLKQIEAEQVERKAVSEQIQINGIAVSKFQYPERRKWAKRKRVSLQAVAGDWILIADNESIFRSVLRRVLGLDKPAAGTLANQEAFSLAMGRCKLPAQSPDDIRWFIEPFGYVKLARAIEIENEPVKKMEDDWTAVLAKNGLRAIRSAAGTVSLATPDQEALFRIFVLAPKTGTRDEAEKRMISILNFGPDKSHHAEIPAWVPTDISGLFTAQWDFNKALKGVGPIVDSFMKEEGAFDDLIDTIKNEPDFRVDIPKLVGQLDNKFTVISAVTKPLESDSEKLAVGIKLDTKVSARDQRKMLESIGRAVRGKEITLAGIKVIVDDRTEEVDDLDFEDAPLPFEEEEDDEKFAGGDGGGANFAMFEKKYIAIEKGYLFVCNDKDYLKVLLTRKDDSNVSQETDFKTIRTMLFDLVDKENVRTMRFGRIDKILELNYTMLQKGELSNSKTLIGKIIVEMMMANEGQPDAVEIDPTTLPADFNQSIAPYLGTMGWVMEDESAGWRITGCVLKK